MILGLWQINEININLRDITAESGKFNRLEVEEGEIFSLNVTQIQDIKCITFKSGGKICSDT